MSKNNKLPRIFLIIDAGMIWEAYSDIPVVLLIKNNDKQWMRKLGVKVDPEKINPEEELINDLDEEQVKLPGLAEEEAKHIMVRMHPIKKQKKK